MNEARYREAERRMWESVGVTPTERRLHLVRNEVTVRVQEAGEGPTVLLVHGATNGGASWAPLMAGLPDFHCVALDRPGCGLSDARGRRFDSIDELGAFADTLIVDVLDAMGLDRAHVVATSLGGYVALRSAALHPDRLNRMVQFSWPFGASCTPLSIRLASNPYIGPLVTAIPPTQRTTRAMLRRIGLREAVDSGRFTPTMVDWCLSLLRDTDTMDNDVRSGPRFPVRRMDDRELLPRHLLEQTRTPMLFLWGEGDPFGGPDVARTFVGYLPNAELELWPGAGHAPWIDDPERAARATRAFLDEHAST